jgi:hypothetical protein
MRSESGEHDNLVITGEHVKADYPLRYRQLSACICVHLRASAANDYLKVFITSGGPPSVSHHGLWPITGLL